MGCPCMRHYPDALDCTRMVGMGLQRHEQPLFYIRIGGGCGSSDGNQEDKTNYLDLKKSYEDLEEKYNNIFIESEEKSKLISDLKNSNNELNNQIKNFKLEKSKLENKNEELENEKRFEIN